MARVKGRKAVSTELLGFFVTPIEKKMIVESKPDDISMSEFLKSIVLPVVKRILINRKHEIKDDN